MVTDRGTTQNTVATFRHIHHDGDTLHARTLLVRIDTCVVIQFELICHSGAVRVIVVSDRDVGRISKAAVSRPCLCRSRTWMSHLFSIRGRCLRRRQLRNTIRNEATCGPSGYLPGRHVVLVPSCEKKLPSGTDLLPFRIHSRTRRSSFLFGDRSRDASVLTEE